MTDEEVEALLLKAAVQKAKPILNGEKPYPANSISSNSSIQLTLWEHGYRLVREQVISMGATIEQVDAALAKAKRETGGMDPDDFVMIPPDLIDDLEDAFSEAVETEDAEDDEDLSAYYDQDEPAEIEPSALFEINERVIGGVDDFRVEMFSNESQHAGRPHVKVHLADGAISISIDDPPTIIAGPRGKLRRQSEALKAIGEHRLRLLKLWYDTRPDDQKLRDHSSKAKQANEAVKEGDVRTDRRR